jgi:hypothetical protein
MNRWSSGYVQGGETIVEDTVVVDTWHHALAKKHITVQHKLNTKPWILDNNNVSVLSASFKKYATLMHNVNDTGICGERSGETVIRKCCNFCLVFWKIH